ncbi:Flavin prenyltransferase UbiX [hydrothermal vent metagenome]|uniref:Flavin prenyltransferase UbiX n=1 Tax=hydrothermal vent metagenome TaxID=652676 RepID=A0A3B0VP55_9ZZZZ
MNDRERASYVVAISGASGALYGLRLIRELLSGGFDVDMLITDAGLLILRQEAGLRLEEPGGIAAEVLEKLKADNFNAGAAGDAGPKGRLSYTLPDEMVSPLASGSSLRRAMIICPCSMGLLARVATGVSTNLIERAADCILKEGGRLVVVPRETPLSRIHLKNLLTLSEMGVTIVPAMPAFYQGPETIEDIINFVVGKVLDTLGVGNNLYKRWNGLETENNGR